MLIEEVMQANIGTIENPKNVLFARSLTKKVDQNFKTSSHNVMSILHGHMPICRDWIFPWPCIIYHCFQMKRWSNKIS